MSYFPCDIPYMSEEELEDICNKTSMIDCMLKCHFEPECEAYYNKYGIIPCEGNHGRLIEAEGTK